VNGASKGVIQIDQVSRWFGDVIALNAVDLQFRPGVTGLLGPNGAGKTTLIRLLVGLASPGSGSVALDGQPIRNNIDSLARIGYVADGDALYDELTARRFLEDQAAMRGFGRSEGALRAVEVLERVGLSDAVDRRSGGFSKGMRQRLKLAQAMLHEPDVVVMDEPLTGLDPVMRRDYIRLTRELGDEGKTVVVSSHVLHEIEAMTDSIVLMRYGQVLAEGTVADIRDKLDTHARRIRLVTNEPRAFATRLLQEEGLLAGLALEENALVVETRHPDRLCSFLGKAAVDRELDVASIEPLDDDLSSVFAYLVQGRETGA
jgi:ABC-2 type transport system ATP-binding protein